MTEALKITRDGGVVTLTMNEPASRNALSDAMREGLSSAINDLTVDPDVQAVILTGSGGVFCAGGDLKKMLANHKAGLVSGAEDILPRMKHLHGWIKLLRDLHEARSIVAKGEPEPLSPATGSLSPQRQTQRAQRRTLTAMLDLLHGAKGEASMGRRTAAHYVCSNSKLERILF